VLVPSVKSIVERELGRGSSSYRDWLRPGGTLADAVRLLQSGLEQVPRRGLWLDTTGQTPEQSVESILADNFTTTRW
jgi:hypothetical protein